MSRRHNPPPPPPVKIRPDARFVGTVLHDAVVEHHADWRAVYAVGRVVEEVFRELDRRGDLPDDRLESLLTEVSRYVHKEIDDADLAETSREFWPIHTDYVKDSAAAWTRFAVMLLVDTVLDDNLTAYDVASNLMSICDRVRKAWMRLGEPLDAASTRVMRTLRRGLEG